MNSVIKYKRKFLVPGDSIYTCYDFFEECEAKHQGSTPCEMYTTIGNERIFAGRDWSKCPYPINKPREYIVAETEDGQWQCNCKYWTTHVPRRDCKHIKRAKENPEKYEITTDWTNKTVEKIRKVTG